MDDCAQDLRRRRNRGGGRARPDGLLIDAAVPARATSLEARRPSHKDAPLRRTWRDRRNKTRASSDELWAKYETKNTYQSGGARRRPARSRSPSTRGPRQPRARQGDRRFGASARRVPEPRQFQARPSTARRAAAPRPAQRVVGAAPVSTRPCRPAAAPALRASKTGTSSCSRCRCVRRGLVADASLDITALSWPRPRTHTPHSLSPPRLPSSSCSLPTHVLLAGTQRPSRRRPRPRQCRRRSPRNRNNPCGNNQCVGCTRRFFTKSFLGDDVAVLAPSSGDEPASPRHRAGVASMASRTKRGFSTKAP